CVVCHAMATEFVVTSRHGFLSRRMAFARTNSFLATALNTSFPGLPAAWRRSANVFNAGLNCHAENAAMYTALRTTLRPPTMNRFQHWPQQTQPHKQQHTNP